MEHIRQRIPPHRLEKAVVTLGNFDGVHLGHQKIFELVIQKAREIGGESVVYTFEPHPMKVLYPGKRMPLITSYKERARLVEEMGIDVLVSAPFDLEFAKMEASDFVRDVLVGAIGARIVLVGYDYAFGKGRRGDTELLKKMGEEMGFEVVVVPPVMLNGSAVSSSRIRSVIEEEGDVALAARMMGREFSVTGKVVEGHRRGKALGFPTANLQVESELMPRPGVYAVKVGIVETGGTFGGMANLGTNPTFGNGTLSFEVHLFDFQGDLYGKELTVSFVDRLRDERKFPSPEALVEQLRKDEERSRAILSSRKD